MDRGLITHPQIILSKCAARWHLNWQPLKTANENTDGPTAEASPWPTQREPSSSARERVAPDARFDALLQRVRSPPAPHGFSGALHVDLGLSFEDIEQETRLSLWTCSRLREITFPTSYIYRNEVAHAREESGQTNLNPRLIELCPSKSLSVAGQEPRASRPA